MSRNFSNPLYNINDFNLSSFDDTEFEEEGFSIGSIRLHFFFRHFHTYIILTICSKYTANILNAVYE